MSGKGEDCSSLLQIGCRLCEECRRKRWRMFGDEDVLLIL